MKKIGLQELGGNDTKKPLTLTFTRVRMASDRAV